MTALMDRPVLTLNRQWVPVHTSTVKEAIGLVAKGAAKIIEPDTYMTHDLSSWDAVSKARSAVGDRLIHSQHLAILVPEVILLTSYEGMAERGVVFSRKNLFKRDRFTCRYCGAQPGPAELTVDHVLPRSRGGLSSWTNCVLACVACNAKKADKTPTEAGMKLRGTAKKPTWKMLAQVAPRSPRPESWNAFLSRAYWNVELEP